MAGLLDDEIVVIKEEMDDDGTKQIVKLSDTLNFLQEDLSLLESHCDQEYSRISAPVSEDEKPESSLESADSLTVYACPLCNRVTSSKTDLKRHLKVHKRGFKTRMGRIDAAKMVQPKRRNVKIEQDKMTQGEMMPYQNGAMLKWRITNWCKTAEASEEQSPTTAEQQLISQKGRGMFTCDGYSYVFDRFSGDREKKFWRCERKAKGHLCKARLHTDIDDAVLKQINDHNHEPNAAKIEANIVVRTAVKARSVEVREVLPLQLINAAKQNLTLAAAGEFPATSALRKVVSRAREVKAAPAAPALLADRVIPENYRAYEVQPGEAVNYTIADNGQELTACEVPLDDYPAIDLDQSTSSETSQRGSSNSDCAIIMTEAQNGTAQSKPAGKRKVRIESPSSTTFSTNSKVSKPSDVEKMIEAIENISDHTTCGPGEEDPDELFLKSLLPEIRRMTAKQKLLFKMRMIKFIADTAYNQQDDDLLEF